MITKPNALTRLRAAVDFYKHGWRKFNLNPPATKKIPFIWPRWYSGQPQWQLINYEAYAEEGFAANAVIYSAIMYKVRSITIAPLRAYSGDQEKPELLPPEHPLQQLCMRPNPFQSWSEFQALATVYFNLSGNNYTVLERSGGEVAGMYHLRPDRVFIVPSANKRQLIGYWYVPEGQSWVDGIPYLPQDIIHIKLPNPMDPLDGLGYGVSPLSPAARNGDVDNDLTKFFSLFFKSGAMPPGVLTFDAQMMDDDVSRARERWMEIYGGYENWTEPAVLDQGGKYERIGYTFEEMDVSAIDARNESRIVAPFGVPLNLIESRPELVQSTYSNKAEDRTMFWEDTMIPELRWFETDYQYYLQGERGEFVMFDLTGIPALSMTQSERVDKFSRAFELRAIERNEYRAELGLDPMPEDEMMAIEPEPSTDGMEGMPEAEDQAEEELAKTNGNVKGAVPIIETATQKLIGQTNVKIPFGTPFQLNDKWWQLNFVGKDAYYVQEIEEPASEKILRDAIATIEGGKKEEPAEVLINKAMREKWWKRNFEDDDGGGKKKAPDRLGFWTKADQLATDYEAEFGDAATEALEQDLIYVEATINDTNREALDNRASLNWDIVLEAVGVYFATAAAANWQRHLSLPVFELMTERVNRLNTEFEQTFPSAELLSQEWFNEYTITFAQPINDTTEETVRRLIEQGRLEGWSVPTTMEHLRQVFEHWTTGNLTAEEFTWFGDRMPDYRREMIARTETMKALNVVSYQLYGAWGIEEHEWLATNDNRVREAHWDTNGQRVRIGTPFDVGGEALLYPLDPNGSPGNTINCRCTTAPIVE